MFLFQITEIVELDIGLVLMPGLVDQYVPVGTQITIVRPDKTEIEAKITGIYFGSNRVTIDKPALNWDIPIGSEVWAKTSITYDLTRYIFLDLEVSGSNMNIIFQHKIDPGFLIAFELSDTIVDINRLGKNTCASMLKIQLVNAHSSETIFNKPVAGRAKDFREVIIYSDLTDLEVVFKCTTKSIRSSNKPFYKEI